MCQQVGICVFVNIFSYDTTIFLISLSNKNYKHHRTTIINWNKLTLCPNNHQSHKAKHRKLLYNMYVYVPLFFCKLRTPALKLVVQFFSTGGPYLTYDGLMSLIYIFFYFLCVISWDRRPSLWVLLLFWLFVDLKTVINVKKQLFCQN
jgi:hypothetical protein